MFTDEQPPDYSFPSRFDVYPDDFLEIESDTFNDDSFDSKGEKIKEAELLIDQLDLPCDILSEYDSFNSQDFSRDDVLFSPDNEDRDFDPPFYELLVFKEVPNSMRLLPFSSKNEEKVFKPGIYTFKKFYCCFLSETSHPAYRIQYVALGRRFDTSGRSKRKNDETMEQYMSKTRGDYASGIIRPTINQDTHFELKGQFLKELRDNTLSGSEHEDANEHIKKF
nr:hypothetical protein [Tanacetum cinerariifolium]